LVYDLLDIDNTLIINAAFNSQFHEALDAKAIFSFAISLLVPKLPNVFIKDDVHFVV